MGKRWNHLADDIVAVFPVFLGHGMHYEIPGLKVCNTREGTEKHVV
jgi:hypothetical protein